MSSGAKVSKSCVEEFEKMKMKQAYPYIVFKLNDSLNEIVVDKAGDKGEGYEEMKAILFDAASKKECRYAVFDLHFEFKGAPKNKLMFIAWSPDSAAIKQKMVYTSSKDYLKKSLQLVLECQATDADEVSMDSLVERAQRTMKD